MKSLKRVMVVFLWCIAAFLIAGCEQKTIEFTIVSQNGETHFAFPKKMLPKHYNGTIDKKSQSFTLDLDSKELGGSGYYHLRLQANGNNNSLVTKTLPDRVAKAEETASDFKGYKKYTQHKDPEMDFLLVGQEASGKTLYLQCAKQINPNTKCTYYGIFDEKLAYEFMFPIAQLNDIENLIVYAQSQITNLIITE